MDNEHGAILIREIGWGESQLAGNYIYTEKGALACADSNDVPLDKVTLNYLIEEGYAFKIGEELAQAIWQTVLNHNASPANPLTQ